MDSCPLRNYSGNISEWSSFWPFGPSWSYPRPDCVSKVEETSKFLCYSFRPGPYFIYCLKRVPVSSKSTCSAASRFFSHRIRLPIVPTRNYNPDNVSGRDHSNYWRHYKAISLPASTIKNSVFCIFNYFPFFIRTVKGGGFVSFACGPLVHSIITCRPLVRRHYREHRMGCHASSWFLPFRLLPTYDLPQRCSK